MDTALKKNAVALTMTLGDDIKLFDSLVACIKDCGETVTRIEDVLLGTQTHGRVGNLIRQPSTHWKLKDKTQELALLRDRVVSFHTVMNMSLQMINICIVRHGQTYQKSQQDHVLEGISQLRRQIKRLSIIAQRRDTDEENLPSTIQQCLDSAIALDISASTVVDDDRSVLGAMTQAPLEKVQLWMRNSDAWEAPASDRADFRRR